MSYKSTNFACLSDNSAPGLSELLRSESVSNNNMATLISASKVKSCVLDSVPAKGFTECLRDFLKVVRFSFPVWSRSVSSTCRQV